MPFPLAMIAGLTGLASAGLGVASTFSDKRKRYRIPIERLMQLSRERMYGDVNQASSNLGTQLAPSLASRGLQNTGIGASMLATHSGNLMQGGLRDLATQRQELEAQQQGYDKEYEDWRAGRLSRILGSLAEAGGQVAGGLESMRQNKELEGMLSQLYGGGGGVSYASGL